MNSFFTIGIKIAALPFHGRALENPHILGPVVAFTGMLSDCLKAALHGNLDESPHAVVIVPIPSGYYGLASVLDRDAGLNTVKKLLDRYFIPSGYKIVGKTILDGTWKHYSGANLGLFEQNMADNAEWSQAIQNIRTALAAARPKTDALALPPPAPATP